MKRRFLSIAHCKHCLFPIFPDAKYVRFTALIHSSDDVNFDLLLRKARSQDPGVLKCPFPGCKDNICSVNSVSPHFREAHGIRRSDQNKWVACLIPNCGGGAKPKGGNLVRHYKEHILKGDCLRCEFSTSRNSDMKVHVRDRHGIEVEKAEYFTYKFKFQ